MDLGKGIVISGEDSSIDFGPVLFNLTWAISPANFWAFLPSCGLFLPIQIIYPVPAALNSAFFIKHIPNFQYLLKNLHSFLIT